MLAISGDRQIFLVNLWEVGGMVLYRSHTAVGFRGWGIFLHKQEIHTAYIGEDSFKLGT